MKNTNYEPPILSVLELKKADIVRTSLTPDSDTVEFDANSFIGGGQ